MVKNKRKGQHGDDVLSSNGENEYSEEAKYTGNIKDEDSRNFEISDYLSNKDNSGVLKKFFIFVLLIILSPIILIGLYKYLFIFCLRMTKNNALLYSIYFVVLYIFSLTIFYAYLAFQEDNRYLNIERNKKKIM
ncbi:conserved Plasmodium protein, unknown function [Plasmodium berghei]|uniref:Uncharacterized protein n=2 Tax=Plasmodium berghei TaxID=5821 RepID=A0A509APR5_PLABA|nr:conserved Plasmodium protein, unknown function [Plasmodium berghei ANKA]CXJ04542.1 conserved Plasmodium protein, unknown function [Plasmodium berghei]SCL98680.1 conserved Plasmodium protein, unknown function [Plasmodium berghei]SCM16875.1 conserved Plasmodium protein, unknown function [Plasmodium berghei]SCM18673.1 conserved Plasmodium protein, unknown function [Plasmodium berghei]SCN28108.1 conserved Plasmodium protein, unknown function [Plasmodium berghei]|eukprot:XP_034423758.1 conserved Plasmodium protein, unknown function [Plasmodium berghei ANKA]